MALEELARTLIVVDVTEENKAKIFKAFEGATYAFTMTIASATATEAAEGKNLVDAAKAANVRLLVWSGLESLAEVSGGKYTNVVAFENKAEVTRYAQASGTPVVYVPAAGYMQNYTTNHSIPKKQPDGSFAMFNVMSPDSKVFLIDTDEDYGLFVRKAIESDGGETELLTHGDILTPVEIARTISEGTGKTVSYVQISPEAYKKSLTSNGLPEFVATMLTEMWLTIDEFGYYGKKDAGPSLQGLARKPRTFTEFVKATDWSSILV